MKGPNQSVKRGSRSALRIAATPQGILDVRGQYPDCSLADLYDETSMPPALRKAHQANDRVVLAGLRVFVECVIRGDEIADAITYSFPADSPDTVSVP